MTGSYSIPIVEATEQLETVHFQKTVQDLTQALKSLAEGKSIMVHLTDNKEFCLGFKITLTTIEVNG